MLRWIARDPKPSSWGHAELWGVTSAQVVAPIRKALGVRSVFNLLGSPNHDPLATSKPLPNSNTFLKR
jgi:hypothetical protein